MAKATKRAFTPSKYEEIKEWDHDGKHYERGDFIDIDCEDGEFKFWSVDTNKDGREIVCVFWVGRHFRYFYADHVENPDVKKDPVCKDHPGYGAKRQPRTGCPRCEAAYEAALEKRKRKYGTV